MRRKRIVNKFSNSNPLLDSNIRGGEMVDLSELGSFTLENTVDQVRFPEKISGKRSRLEYMLGKGISTKDPSKAADHFLDREFPQLCQDVPHPPLFVPDTFIYKHFPEKVSRVKIWVIQK